MEFELDGITYDVIVERKAFQKNTYIRVKKDMCIHVTTGKLTSNRFIMNMIK